VRRALAEGLPVPLCLGVRRYYNRIFLAGRELPSARALRRRLAGAPALARHLPQLQLRSLRP
jgi:hypothetical protein